MTTDGRTKFRNIILALIVFAAAAGVYSNTLRHGFVYDDLVIVRDNPNIRHIGNARLLFGPEYFHVSGERTFRPLNTLTYMIDYRLGGGRAAVFHASSVLWHAACAVILFFLILRIAGGLALPSFFGALLFAAHPLNSEAVNAISFREDPMALLFTAAALLVYARYVETFQRGEGIPWGHDPKLKHKFQSCPRKFQNAWRAAAGVAALFFLGLCSKETAAALPLLIVIYEWIFGGRLRDSWRSRAPVWAAVVAAGAAFFALYFALAPHADAARATLPGGGPAAAAAAMLPALRRYLSLFINPTELCADYTDCVDGAFMGPGPSGALLAALLFIGIAARRRSPVLSFGILFFFAALAPVSNVVPFGAVFAERYAYMPAAALCLAAAALFFEPAGDHEASHQARFLYIGFFVLACPCLGALTMKRNNVWRSDLALWSHTTACNPRSSRAHTNLGIALNHEGRFRDAADSLEKAATLDSAHYEAWNALGNAYTGLGKNMDAINAFNQAVKLNPESKYTYFNLALVYSMQGRLTPARENLLAALKRDPEYTEAAVALAGVYLKAGLHDPAEQILVRVLNKNPDLIQARAILAVVYRETGRYAPAGRILRELLRELPPNHPMQRQIRSNLKIIRERTAPREKPGP